MVECAELQIVLRAGGDGAYALQFMYRASESESEHTTNPAIVRIDRNAFEQLAPDPLEYGRQLAAAVAEPQQQLVQRLSSAADQGVPLRIRLLIEPSAKELQQLYWELLCHPATGQPLLHGEHVFFSRYLLSDRVDSRPVRRRARTQLQALVVIASPNDLCSKWRLAPLDVDGELSRAFEALRGISHTVLASAERPDVQGRPTRSKLLPALGQGIDLLYLVCHGRLLPATTSASPSDQSAASQVETGPHLWLEDESGASQHFGGAELAEEIANLQQPPRLVVLASCQSAGQGDDRTSEDGGVLAALGPSLADAGVPAVVAMQGNVQLRTVRRFMPRFFQALQEDGQIDRAMSLARNEVKEHPDSAVPVLFMRLRSGRLWYVPGFSTEQSDFTKWKGLQDRTQEPPRETDYRAWCVPILGPGLQEPFWGLPGDTARAWAKEGTFPLSAHLQEDLARVAQYLMVEEGGDVYGRLRKRWEAELRRRYGSVLPADSDRFEKLLSAVGAHRRNESSDPYRLLAELHCPLYLTTNPDDLLVEALRAQERVPEIRICPWNERIKEAHKLFRVRKGYQPTWQRPLVYYLYGRLCEPDTLVLTEDDYFRYLVGVTENAAFIPESVRRALAEAALLFLGFQLDDWNFRVLFHSVKCLQDRPRAVDKWVPNVAAQIAPDEDRFLIPARAQRYLDEYLGGSKISIYWGTVDDFVRDFRRHIPSNDHGK